MARTAKFKLPGIRTWIDIIEKEVAQEAAEQIVKDLKQAGPYYTGEFEENWVVEPGDKRIPADKESGLTQAEKWEGFTNGGLPMTRRTTPVAVPAGFTQYSIGNRMKYRDVAMDLAPGRFEPGKNNTADKDWYVKYAQGGGLKSALKEATGNVARDPKIKGYNGPK